MRGLFFNLLLLMSLTIGAQGIYLSTEHMNRGAYSGEAGVAMVTEVGSTHPSYVTSTGGINPINYSVADNTEGVILTGAGGWYRTTCPYCGEGVWRQKNHGAQNDMYDLPNGSSKHVCNSVPIGDAIVFILLLALAYAIYISYKRLQI